MFLPFTDRLQAGKILAEKISQHPFPSARARDRVLVLALARGGIPIGQAVAEKNQWDWEALLCRKIGAPRQPEFGIGAIIEDGEPWIDWQAANSVGATQEDLDRVIAEERAELRRREKIYREGKTLLQCVPDLTERPILLVDDGLATGVTARATIHYLKHAGAKTIYLAVPVASPQAASDLRAEVADFICLETPKDFGSVGQFYQDFRQVSDREVLAHLSRRDPALSNKSHS